MSSQLSPLSKELYDTQQRSPRLDCVSRVRKIRCSLFFFFFIKAHLFTSKEVRNSRGPDRAVDSEGLHC